MTILDKRPAGDLEIGEGSPRDSLLILRLMSRDLGDSFYSFRLRFNVFTEKHDLSRIRESPRELTDPGYKMDRLVRSLLESVATKTKNFVIKEESIALATFISRQRTKMLRR